MRVVALLSGGKDSVAAIEVAKGFGWDVVGALVLVPNEDDTWMFHAPNAKHAATVAKAMGIPVHLAPVRRTGSTNGKPGPDGSMDEETQDLHDALAALQREWSFEGVLSGALRSEYQRTRIERVGEALGLKTFTPLWHKSAETYLESLLQAGYDVRFVRTAAEGVPNAWVGTPLTFDKLDQLRNHPARPDIAGEGGEYETIVLDAPHFQSRIEVIESHIDESASRATWVIDRMEVRARDA